MPIDLLAQQEDNHNRLIEDSFGNDAPTAKKIMKAESSGNPSAQNTNKNGTTDGGLFQINSIHIPTLIKEGIISKADDLYIPEKNVAAAKFLKDRDGWQPWDSSKSKWGEPKEPKDLFAENGIDLLEDNKTPPVEAQKQTPQPSKSIGGLVSNAISEVPEVAKGMWSAAKLAGKLSPLGQIITHLPGATSGFQDITNIVKNVPSAVVEAATNIKNSIRDKGLGQSLYDYTYEHPLSTAMNVSGGLGLAGKAAGAGNLMKTANVLDRASLWTNPVNIVASPATRVINRIRGAGVPAEQIIETGINKGIRPGVEGNRTFHQAKTYMDKAKTAVQTIVDNKNNLALTDEFGETVNKLPENLREFSQAIDQTKRNIFTEYNAMAKDAGQAGASINLNPIGGELNKVVNSKVLNDIAPETVNYAKQRMKALVEKKITVQNDTGLLDYKGNKIISEKQTTTGRGKYTADEAQEAIQHLNNSLEAFYKNPSYDTASKAYIDSLIANRMRSALDDVIEKTTGAGYQGLKNKYGALKSIERDVNRRAIVDARKNVKGLVDFSDIFSGGEIVRGLLTLNPGAVGMGAASKSIAWLYKFKNNPNTIVKKMFEGVSNPKKPFASGTTGNLANAAYQTGRILDQGGLE